MNKRRNLSKCVSSPKRFLGIVALACLFPFIWAAPVAAWPIIYVDAPSDLTTSNVSPSSITLTWQDNSFNEDGFQVEICTADSKFEFLAKLPSDTTVFTCNGLSDNTQYWFRVQALGNNDILRSSPYSNVASAKTLLMPKTKLSLNSPGDLAAAGTSKYAIKLSWKDNNLNEYGYAIERKTDSGAFILITQMPANYVSYTDLSVSEGFTYTYRVMAKGDGYSTSDSGYSNEATATTRSKASGLLKAPSGLAAFAVSSTEISLTWTDNATNESGYSIERTTGNSFEIVTTLPVNASTYIDQGLQDNTKYTYRVRALGVSENSPYSNSSTATTGKEASASPVILKFYIENNVYYINNQPNLMDTTPIISDGRTLLPIAYAAEPLGISVYWDEAEREVTLSRKGAVIEMWLDQSIARVNGVDTYIDPGNLNVAPRVYANRTMLPLSFVVSNLNCKVEWFSSMQEVRVTYPVPQDKRVQL